ncbi:hypothetical protein KKA13_01725 [Patescibacteria group bacterium]|nr:hypothetical protein [Patescibacteria group bacterium]MBU1613201.1 hypothetical protein [Patescibacteria group bacterium]
MPEQNFLEEYVLKILQENGFENLSDENRKLMLPQFVAQAEKRIGAALLPLLDEEKAKKFTELAQDEKTTPEIWWNFWNENIPNFTEVVKKELDSYAEEVKKALVA